MNLTPRLQTIANHIPKNSICADIGTDHAYLPIYLIKNQICPRVIATDVNKGPLASANSTIKSAGFEKEIETRLGNGLQPIKPKEVNTIVIAGMGGLLIRDILDKSKEISKNSTTLILQPMTFQREVREYLLENNFMIIKEDLAQEDQRIYEIIIATTGQQTIDKDVYLEIGKPLVDNNHPLLLPLIHRKKGELLKIIQQCEGKGTVNAESRIRECFKKIQSLEEVEGCL